MFTPEIKIIIESARNWVEAHECTPGLEAKQHDDWCELFRQLSEKILPTGGHDSKWVFWITSKRGDIGIWGDYDEWVDLGEVSSREEFRNLWLDYYPDETTWHQVTIQNDGNDLQIFFERWFSIINMTRSCLSSNGTYGTVELVDWIFKEVSEAVDQFLESPEKYNNHVCQNLPNYCRIGRIKRSVLWDHEIGDRFDLELGEEALLKLEAVVSAPVEDLVTMTASEYFGLCEICYNANEYFEDDNSALSAREKYQKLADRRHGGLLDLVEDDSNAFWEWFGSSEWQGAHPWEICRGGNSTHISLSPVRTLSNKWQLWLSGFSMSRALETAKMAVALYDAKVPFELERGKEMLRMLRGEDFVGVVPKHVTPIYCHDLFPERDVFFFINPWNDEAMANFVSRYTEWYEVPLLEKL